MANKDSTAGYAQECLAAHNKYRAMHGCPPLKLNNTITAFATEWAQNLAKRGVMEHRENNSYGENIYWGNAEKISGEQPVLLWYNEIANYNFAKAGYSANTGHFTQLVWKNCTELGVGIAKSNGKTFVVANYNPPGNFDGEFKENVPPKKK